MGSQEAQLSLRSRSSQQKANFELPLRVFLPLKGERTLCQQTWYTTAADTVIYEGNAPKYLMSTHSEKNKVTQHNKIVSLGMQSQCSAAMSRCLTCFWVVVGNSHKLHTGSTLGSHPGGFEPRIFCASVRSSGDLLWNHSANRCITTQVKPVHLFSCRALIQPPQKKGKLVYFRGCFTDDHADEPLVTL